MISALDDFQASFRNFKRQSALLDFDDLLYFARDLLRTNPEVRAALANRYRHVLVDEFQDTDPSNARSCSFWAVKTVLISPGKNSDLDPVSSSWWRSETVDIPLSPRRYPLLQASATGDTDSIPENVLTVTDNFRSQKAILEFVNERFTAPLTSIGYEPLVRTVAPYSNESAPRGVSPSASRIPCTRHTGGVNLKRVR